MKVITIKENLSGEVLTRISAEMSTSCILLDEEVLNTLAKSTQDVVEVENGVVSYIWPATKTAPVSILMLNKKENRVLALNRRNGMKKNANKVLLKME